MFVWKFFTCDFDNIKESNISVYSVFVKSNTPLKRLKYECKFVYWINRIMGFLA